MAETILYVDGQQVLPIIAYDMLSMIGWEDSKEIKYCTRDNTGVVPYDIVLSSDRYIGYLGDEDVFLAISKNRNVTLCINLDTFEDVLNGEDKKYDYFARTFYLSGICTELSLPDIGLEIHKVNSDWIHLSWEYNDILFEADISISL